MLEQLTQFIIDTFATVKSAAIIIFFPAMFFFLLGLAVKKRALFGDIRRAIPETSLNIQIMVFNLIFVIPLIGVASQFMSDLVDRYSLLLISPAVWESFTLPITVLIAVFIGDFVGYWRHRLEHTKILWPSHAVHHSDTEMTWLALERFHPINRMTTFIIDAGILLLLGFPPTAVLVNGWIRHFYGYFIHADLPWTYGRMASVFVSPAMHRWHHAAQVEAFNTNYATVFSVFDHVFGTYRVPGPCDVALGVTDDMAPTLGGQMIYPFQARAYKRLFTKNSK